MNHGDIKPDNILIMRFNPVSVKIGDLGCGSQSHGKDWSVTISGKGTVPYMAPELM